MDYIVFNHFILSKSTMPLGRREVKGMKENNMQPCKCGVCKRMLLARADYVNHLKSHHNNQKEGNYANLLYRPADNISVCSKVCS